MAIQVAVFVLDIFCTSTRQITRDKHLFLLHMSTVLVIDRTLGSSCITTTRFTNTAVGEL